MKKKYLIKPFLVLIVLCLCLLGWACSDTSNNDEQDHELVYENINDPEDYDVSIYLGNFSDPIRMSSLAEEYGKDTGLKIEAVTTVQGASGNRALWRILNSSVPPAAFIIDTDTNINRIISAGFLAEDMDQETAEVLPGIPLRFKYNAYACDRRLFDELILGADAGVFLPALEKASYEEWEKFIIKLSDYIRTGTVSNFTVNGKKYSFNRKKGVLTEQLNGVFAAEGGELDFLGKDLLDRLLATTDSATWEKALGKPRFSAYAEAIDLITGNLAGLYACGVRGDDFVDPSVVNRNYALRTFTEGHAVFLDISEDDADIIQDTNAELAANLALLPVKMPFAKYGLDSEVGATDVNRCISISTETTICINAGLSEEKKKEIRDFIEWFVTVENYGENHVMHEAAAYYDEGNYLPYKNGNESYESWTENFLGQISEPDRMPEWLSFKDWSSEYIDEIAGTLHECAHATE